LKEFVALDLSAATTEDGLGGKGSEGEKKGLRRRSSSKGRPSWLFTHGAGTTPSSKQQQLCESDMFFRFPSLWFQAALDCSESALFEVGRLSASRRDGERREKEELMGERVCFSQERENKRKTSKQQRKKLVLLFLAAARCWPNKQHRQQSTTQQRCAELRAGICL
jgi:hypothetical protein